MVVQSAQVTTAENRNVRRRHSLMSTNGVNISTSSFVNFSEVFYPAVIDLLQLAIMLLNSGSQSASSLKAKAEYSSSWESISELRGVTCHMG